jgi:hypothetical protein
MAWPWRVFLVESSTSGSALHCLKEVMSNENEIISSAATPSAPSQLDALAQRIEAEVFGVEAKPLTRPKKKPLARALMIWA